MTRSVITGLGAITPLGNDPDTFWQNMKEGVSGADRIRSFDPSGMRTQIACEVKDFVPTDWMQSKDVRRLGRASQFSLATARQAVEHSGLDFGSLDPTRIGVVFNTGGGGLDSIASGERRLQAKGPRSVSPFLAPNAMPNCVSTVISIELGITGPVVTSTLACAAGSYALLDATYHLQRGDADVIVAGGTESAVSPVIVASFARLGALSGSHDAQSASRPFDADRDGLVFGEGAVGFIVETEEHALARGATIYAEILGGAVTADAYHLTMPKPGGGGAAAAMRKALAASSRTIDDVDAVFAHATSTPLGDAAEAKALEDVFGERIRQIPVTATKSQLGHTFGAAGALSSLAAVFSIGEGILCPTINYSTPDPECNLDCVPNEARSHDVRTAMVDAFGFGGQNVVILLAKYEASST